MKVDFIWFGDFAPKSHFFMFYMKTWILCTIVELNKYFIFIGLHGNEFLIKILIFDKNNILIDYGKVWVSMQNGLFGQKEQNIGFIILFENKDDIFI